LTGRINIDTSLYLSTQDFKIVGEVDYGEFGAGRCVENHPIKYGIEVADESGDIYVYGNTCIYKPFVFKHWQLTAAHLEDPNVEPAGRNLYIIARDELEDYINNIPHPKDPEIDWNFEKLNKILKKVIKDAKSKKNKHTVELRKQKTYKAKKEKWNTTHKEQCDLMTALEAKDGILQENNMFELIDKDGFYDEFIGSVLDQHSDMRDMSEKQIAIINKILDFPETREEVEAASQTVSTLLTKGISNLQSYSENEREYILSFQTQFYKYGRLSPKQIAVLTNIVEDNKSQYIGRLMTSWITGKKTSIPDTNAKIIGVSRETQKALLAKFEVNGISFEDWVPKSQLVPITNTGQTDKTQMNYNHNGKSTNSTNNNQESKTEFEIEDLDF
jgi:hypothetical protein